MSIVESGYVEVGGVSEVALGKMKKFNAGGIEVLVVNVDGSYYALFALCTHYGGDLSEGSLNGKIVTCPNHGAKFDVTTGKVVSGPTEPLGRDEIEDEPLFPVKVENQKIFVKLE